MKIYGNEKTNLTLSDKAQEYLDKTDPIRIEEFKTDDGYIYNIRGCFERYRMTAEDVNRILEELEDETEFSVLPEYIDKWTNEAVDELTVTRKELERLSAEWGISVEELLDQVEEI